MDHEVAGLIRRNLFGIDVDALTMTQAISRCTDAVEHGSYLSVGMVNAAKVVAMHRSERLRDAVGGCGMVLADGQSVVWASRLLGSPLPERVAGIDLFLQLLERAARHAYRVYFLGAQPDVLGRMLTEVGRRYPGLTVAGARHGYFPAEDEPAVAAEVRRSDPDLLFVAMSPPRKELFVSKWGEGTRSNVVHGVGGSFDVLAGLTRRAPAWYQTHGLEWLYRAWQEPARLGRRYATTNMSFIALVARELLRRGVRPGAALPGAALPGAALPGAALPGAAPPGGAPPGNGAAGADELQRAAAAAGGDHA